MTTRPMFAQLARPALVDDHAIDSFVRAMFGTSGLAGGEGVKLVVTVGDRRVSSTDRDLHEGLADAETRAAIRELTQSLAMYGIAHPGETEVPRPAAERIAQALAVLTDPAARRQTLGAALAIFGRRVTAPLERLLHSQEEGTAARLRAFRDALLATGLDGLYVTQGTLDVLRRDMGGLLNDEYLAAVGEHEEQRLRPRLEELDHRVMDMLAATFHRALNRFGTHEVSIADQIVRRLPISMPLREVPTRLRKGFTVAVGQFLEVETSADLSGALRTLSAQYADVMPRDKALTFDDAWYREVADVCWDVIATYC